MVQRGSESLAESEEAIEGRGQRQIPLEAFLLRFLVLVLGKLVLEGKGPFTVWGVEVRSGRAGEFQLLAPSSW